MADGKHLGAIVEKVCGLTLERQRFAYGFVLDSCALRENTHVRLAEECEHTTLRLMHHVYGQAAEKRVDFPATWWDAVKERWFPRWALKRWPARRTVVTFQAHALFPDLVVVKKQHRIVFRGELRWEGLAG